MEQFNKTVFTNIIRLFYRQIVAKNVLIVLYIRHKLFVHCATDDTLWGTFISYSYICSVSATVTYILIQNAFSLYKQGGLSNRKFLNKLSGLDLHILAIKISRPCDRLFRNENEKIKIFLNWNNFSPFENGSTYV